MSKIQLQQLAQSFDTYASEVQGTLDAVRNALREGDYVLAYDIMNELTQRQAKTSLSMRVILIRAGYVKESS